MTVGFRRSSDAAVNGNLINTVLLGCVQQCFRNRTDMLVYLDTHHSYDTLLGKQECGESDDERKKHQSLHIYALHPHPESNMPTGKLAEMTGICIAVVVGETVRREKALDFSG